MKLKYNYQGETDSIPFSTRKPSGKRLAIHHNDQNHYAKVVPPDDAHASNLPVGVNGEIFAVQSQAPPEITAVNVAPSAVAVMQGQSATATVSAIGNDAVTGLSYGLSGAPTWITISDDLILIQPSDSDLGIANVKVIARDTGSDALSSAMLRAEAKLRPIISSLSIIPPSLTVVQGQSATAAISAVANEAVTGLSYSINGASSSWISLNEDSIIVAPTDSDLGSCAVDVFAYDTNSSASAASIFNAVATKQPRITSFTTTPQLSTRTLVAGQNLPLTLSATGNEAVDEIIYSGSPSWVKIVDNKATIETPASLTAGDTVTISLKASDSTGLAESVISAAKTVYEIPNLVVDPKYHTLLTSSSGNITDTINITVTSNSSGELSFDGYRPNGASSLTSFFNDTLDSSTGTVTGVLQLIFPRAERNYTNAGSEGYVSQTASGYYRATKSPIYFSKGRVEKYTNGLIVSNRTII